MKNALFTCTLSLTLFLGYAQQEKMEGIWYVKDKIAPSDFDFPEVICLIKDSTSFNSKSMVDTMYCVEYFRFEPDSNFDCIGECHSYKKSDPWYSSYGSYGEWKLKNKTTIMLDYVHGYYMTRCVFKIKRKEKKLILTRKKMEATEMKWIMKLNKSEQRPH